MKAGILFPLLIAHLLSDFVLQGRATLAARRSMERSSRLRGNLLHGLVYLLCSVAMLLGELTPLALLVLTGLTCIHFLIDLVKSHHEAMHGKKREDREEPLSWSGDRCLHSHGLLLFLADQCSHLVFILIAAWLLSIRPGGLLLTHRLYGLVRDVWAGLGAMVLEQRLLAAAASLLTGVWGVGIALRVYYSDRETARGSRTGGKQETMMDEALIDGGFVIGVLERLVVICVIVMGLQEVIGFILAAKSIARFKKFKDERFMEYFLIGSSLSFLAAILTGVAIRSLLGING